MFWGLAIEPGKRYMQTVAKSFHVSMASLEINNNDNDPVTLMFDYEGQEYVLCNLHKQRAMQCQLDLNFQSGEQIAFYTAGRSRVHLSGYLVEEDDIELSDEDEDEEEEESTQVKQSPVKKRKEEVSNLSVNKKPKLEVAEESDEEEEEDDDDDDDEMDDTFEGLKEDEDEEEEEEDEDDDGDSDEPDDKTSQNKSLLDKQKKKILPRNAHQHQQNGQMQTPQSGKKKKNKQDQKETPKPGTPGTPKSDGPTKTLTGGVVINDVKLGSGPVARAGREVTVYYVGRLKTNNKQFDATIGGPGFKFNLGRGEVIKGWDIGVAGMQVGGKRTITVPPQMAYGKKGQPPVIPPNSVLVFDVELRNVS